MRISLGWEVCQYKSIAKEELVRRQTDGECFSNCSLFPAPYSLFPVPCSLFPIPYSLFPIP